MIGITGTPGTGKSTIAGVLRERGNTVVSASSTTTPFITSYDRDRDTRVIDLDNWAASIEVFDGFIEGHLVHFLPCDKVVVLRCNPENLCGRLRKRGYEEKKVLENAEAEAIDVILIEAIEECGEGRVLEIDTTDRSPEEVSEIIANFYKGTVGASSGGIDWSGWLISRISGCP